MEEARVIREGGFRQAIRDHVTTSWGAGLAGASYLTDVGFQIPHNQNEWISFGVSAAIAIFGLLVKRGSK
jgi:hypothetical protein